MSLRRSHPRPRLRRGFTLIELLTSSAVMVIILAGMTSTVLLTMRSVDTGTNSAAQASDAAEAMEVLNADLALAVEIVEYSAESLEFTVPDRSDSNATPDTVRYQWYGAPGSPNALTRSYNGGSEVVIADDVYAFDLRTMMRTETPDPLRVWAAPDASTWGYFETELLEPIVPSVLFVVGSASSPSTQDQLRAAQLTAWGYDYEMISDTAAASSYEAAFENHNVVLVSEEASTGSVGTKLLETTLGVVNEAKNLNDSELLLSKSNVSFDADRIEIIDDDHLITEGMDLGSLVITTDSGSELHYASAFDLTADAKILAHRSGYASRYVLMALDVGESRYDKSPAPGRRVRLPWAEDNFDFGELTSDGLEILRRSILWAAGANSLEQDASSPVQFHEFTEGKSTYALPYVSVATPPGTATGDLLVATVVIDGNRTISPTTGGWTQVNQNHYDSRVRMGVWWKIADGTEGASQSWGWSGNEESYAFIMRFSGHDPTTPIEASAAQGGRSSSPDCPAITTLSDKAMVVRIGGFDDDDIRVDDPRVDEHAVITMDESSSGDGTCSGAAVYQVRPTAGDTGIAEFSLTNSEQYRTVTIAIKPAS